MVWILLASSVWIILKMKENIELKHFSTNWQIETGHYLIEIDNN